MSQSPLPECAALEDESDGGMANILSMVNMRSSGNDSKLMSMLEMYDQNTWSSSSRWSLEVRVTDSASSSAATSKQAPLPDNRRKGPSSIRRNLMGGMNQIIS